METKLQSWPSVSFALSANLTIVPMHLQLKTLVLTVVLDNESFKSYFLMKKSALAHKKKKKKKKKKTEYNSYQYRK